MSGFPMNNFWPVQHPNLSYDFKDMERSSMECLYDSILKLDYLFTFIIQK